MKILHGKWVWIFPMTKNGWRDMTLWKEIEARLDIVLESVLKNDVYINPKLITWEGTFRTNFHGADIPFSVLKIGNVYRQSGKYYPQVFLK